MNAFQTESLNDYYKSGSSDDLNLFIISINPAFKINKGNTKLVTNLVNKYKLEPTVSREAALMNFIHPGKTETFLNPEDKQAFQQPDVNAYFKVDKDADKMRKEEIYKSLFGDWNTPGTFSYGLININAALPSYSFSDNEMADRQNYKNKTIMNPQEVIKWTEEITGKQIVNFYDMYVNKIYLEGNLSNCVFKKNNNRAFKIIEYAGNAATAGAGYNTISANTPMQTVFAALSK